MTIWGFFFFLDYFITTNKGPQITDMSDMRDKTTQGSRLSRQPLKKKKKSHSIESILAVDGNKFCPGSKNGKKL